MSTIYQIFSEEAFNKLEMSNTVNTQHMRMYLNICKNLEMHHMVFGIPFPITYKTK